jgi:ParB family chromosome partitioning protein
MAYSEKAAVIRLHHSKMFSQGKRNDILEQIKMLERLDEHKGKLTYSQLANKKKSIAKVGQEYGLSKDTVARYLRIMHLTEALQDSLDDGSIAFLTAVTLSYLKKSEQGFVTDCMENHDAAVDMKKAEALRKLSAKNKLDKESVEQVILGIKTPKIPRTPTVKINKAVYAKYFTPTQSAKEVQETVEKALEMYFKASE